MFEGIKMFDFLQNFWNSVPNRGSNIKQAVFSGNGFSKKMVDPC